MTTTGVTVCIPWRPSPSRMAPFRRVMEFWQQTDWPIITADSDTEVFSAAQARNNAVRQAETEIVILCDADTLPPMDNVVTAVGDPVGVTYLHDTWRLIPVGWVDRPISEFAKAPVLKEFTNSFCGAIVTTATEYWRLGGQPEEFEGWGYEDTAFHMGVLTQSTFRRMPGITYSFEHNAPDGSADTPGWSRDFDRNKARFEQYRKRRDHELFERFSNEKDKEWLAQELIMINENSRR